MEKKDFAKVLAADVARPAAGKVSTAGTETANNEPVKKVSVNELITNCLALPAIEADPVFGNLYNTAANDIAKNGIKTAWLQMPNIQAAFNLSLSDIVTACAAAPELQTNYIESAASLIEETASKLGASIVIFKAVQSSTPADKITPVSLSVNSQNIATTAIIETYDEAKNDYARKVSALASAYRLIKQAAKGVRSIDELFADLQKCGLNLKGRGVELSELVTKLSALYE